MKAKALEEKLAEITGSIKKNEESIKEAEKRREEATLRQGELQSKYERKKEERQNALATGKNAKLLNDHLRAMKDDMELMEDEVEGLERKLVNLRVEEKNLKEEEKEVGKEIKEARLDELVPEYNEAAEKLADIVKKIWVLRYELGQAGMNPMTIFSKWDWEQNALETIPKLYTRSDERPSNQYGAASVFFNLGIFKQHG